MKLDSQSRLSIPKALLDSTGLSQKASNTEIRLTVYNAKGLMVIFQSKDFKDKEYHDVIRLDTKGRIFLRRILKEFGIDESSNFVISAMQNQIYIRW